MNGRKSEGEGGGERKSKQNPIYTEHSKNRLPPTRFIDFNFGTLVLVFLTVLTAFHSAIIVMTKIEKKITILLSPVAGP